MGYESVRVLNRTSTEPQPDLSWTFQPDLNRNWQPAQPIELATGSTGGQPAQLVELATGSTENRRLPAEPTELETGHVGNRQPDSGEPELDVNRGHI